MLVPEQHVLNIVYAVLSQKHGVLGCVLSLTGGSWPFLKSVLSWGDNFLLFTATSIYLAILDMLHHLLSKKRQNPIQIISCFLSPDVGAAVSGRGAPQDHRGIWSFGNEKLPQSSRSHAASSLNLSSHVDFLHSHWVNLPPIVSLQWHGFLYLPSHLFIRR